MKISESGRSMVEMLGVLAVIGVLTVGGIIGYRYSVDRIMANRVVTGVRERAVIAGQQRVLGQPLNLKEFYPDTDTDLIYGRFEVEAENAYENLAYGFTADMGVQAITVYDLPQRVCEYVRETDFPDPVLRLVNGREMESAEGECLPDGPRGSDTGLTNAQGFLDGEYHNVVTFVFDEPLKSPCETDSECLPCGRCNEGYCEAKEELEGKVCHYGACCKAGLCDPNGCECPPDDPRPERGCWIERTTDAEPPCPGHKTYEPCACPEGWSATEEPCAGTVNTQTISGYNGVSLTCYQCDLGGGGGGGSDSGDDGDDDDEPVCDEAAGWSAINTCTGPVSSQVVSANGYEITCYKCQDCPKGNACPAGQCCTEETVQADESTGCPAYTTYTPTECQCSEGFGPTPCGDGQIETLAETLDDGTMCYQCQDCPKGNECPDGQCCTETTIQADANTGCPAYTTYEPTECQCPSGFSQTPCGDGQIEKDTETLGNGTICYQCQDCPKGNECLPGTCCTETEHAATDDCPAYKTYTPTTCECSKGTSATCENGQVRIELKETLGDDTKCYTCGGCDDGYTANACDNGYTATETKTVTDIEDSTKVLTCRKCEQCPTSNECLSGTCCTETEHAATDDCPVYKTYEPTECECPSGYTTLSCPKGMTQTDMMTVGHTKCYQCAHACNHPDCCCPAGYYCPNGKDGSRYKDGCDEDGSGKGPQVTAFDCGQGRYCPSGSKEPKDCPGKYTAKGKHLKSVGECCQFAYDTKTNRCVGECEPGYAPNAARECVKCQKGTYSTDGTSCQICSSGWTNAGHTRCYETCPEGWYQYTAKQTCHRECPKNTYYKKGTKTCIACKKGYTTNGKTGQTKCKKITLF